MPRPLLPRLQALPHPSETHKFRLYLRAARWAAPQYAQTAVVPLRLMRFVGAWRCRARCSPGCRLCRTLAKTANSYYPYGPPTGRPLQYAQTAMVSLRLIRFVGAWRCRARCHPGCRLYRIQAVPANSDYPYGPPTGRPLRSSKITLAIHAPFVQ